MSRFSEGTDGVRSFPADGNSVIKGKNTGIGRVCLKDSKKSDLDRATL